MEDTTSGSITLMNFTINEAGELVYMFPIVAPLQNSTVTYTDNSSEIITTVYTQ